MTKRSFSEDDCSPFGPSPKPGVYAVCVSHYQYNVKNSPERILYIGSSKNVKKRVLNEKHPYMVLFRRLEEMLVYTKVIYCDDYIELEKELISFYKPLLNKHYK